MDRLAQIEQSEETVQTTLSSPARYIGTVLPFYGGLTKAHLTSDPDTSYLMLLYLSAKQVSSLSMAF